ncbi:YncE family protein [Sphingomonas xinjiangensis]|uniref:DNA-binding beta-propeller fold protein YncE n=1 Tax=Sphingomonas xinjiangensis TaxID=643568 RepID=A0A840YR80_9SPHN|nr:YncE family protein [Sphingomonas xinjiangensis]MBB5711832.1 DNA-binding beta-propeller fold protein YncE [Sphingomonas xinjiangensis]
MAELAATRKGDLIALLRKDRSEITITATAADAVAKTIRLSSEPSGAAFTRDGRELWVALPKENQIAVFEMRAFRQTALLEVPSGPASIAMSVDGHRAFASMTYAQEIRTFDVKRKTEIARVASTYPGAGRLAVTPNGKALWAYHPNGEIDVIATKPPFKARPSARLEGAIGSLTFVHVGLDSFAYASSPVSSSVSVFDADSFRKVASVRLEAEASGIWTSGDGTAVYAALPTANKVVQIDTASNRVVGTVKVPGTPNALIYVPGAVHQRRAVAKGLP